MARYLTIEAGLKAMSVDVQTCKTLEQAKSLAAEFLTSNSMPYDRIKLAVMALGFPPESEPHIAKEWERRGFQSIINYAPYAGHVLTVELFFHIALQRILSRLMTDRTSAICHICRSASCLFRLINYIANVHLRSCEATKVLFGGRNSRPILQKSWSATRVFQKGTRKRHDEVRPCSTRSSLVAKLLNDFGEMMNRKEQERLRRLFDEPRVDERTETLNRFRKPKQNW